MGRLGFAHFVARLKQTVSQKTGQIIAQQLHPVAWKKAAGTRTTGPLPATATTKSAEAIFRGRRCAVYPLAVYPLAVYTLVIYPLAVYPLAVYPLAVYQLSVYTLALSRCRPFN